MIIVYKSKTGFTKKYAELIAAETGAEVQSVEKTDMKSLTAHDVVVFGGRCCGGFVDGLDDLKKQAGKKRTDQKKQRTKKRKNFSLLHIFQLILV